MNKHGQTLILFIILIPIVLILCAIVVDIGVVISKKAEIKEVVKIVIKDVLDGEDKILKAEKLLIKNNININDVEIINIDNGLNIKIDTKVDSIFGSIIGFKNYDIKMNISGYKNNDKIVFE